MKKMNIEVIHNIPTPYRIHLFNTMHDICKEKSLGFVVNFMRRRERNRPRSWERLTGARFDYRFWHPWSIFHLLASRPDVLIMGGPWASIAGIFISLCLKKKQTKLCWIEPTLKSVLKRSPFINMLKRAFLNKFDFIAIPGRDGAMAVESIGNKKPIIFLPNIVDEAKFRPREERRREELDFFYNEIGIDKNSIRIAICPARLIWEKGLNILIHALGIIRPKNWKVVIMGEGPQKDRLTSMIRARGLDDTVMIKGYIDYDRMPIAYAASDLLILPSVQDTYGLAAVEAMWAGLPLAISDGAGGFRDLLGEDAGNGWVLNSVNQDEFNMSLKEAFDACDEELRQKGRRSRRKAEKFFASAPSIREFIETVYESAARSSIN